MPLERRRIVLTWDHLVDIEPGLRMLALSQANPSGFAWLRASSRPRAGPRGRGKPLVCGIVGRFLRFWRTGACSLPAA
jgi:hypothetical protein